MEQITGVRLSGRVMATFELLSSAALLLLMFQVVANVVGRAALGRSLTGTLEYVQYWYMPLVVFLALVVAEKRGEHIEATVVHDKLPGNVRKEHQLFINLLVIAISLVFAHFGFSAARESMAIGESGGVTGVAVWPVKFVVPVGFVALAIKVMAKSWQLLVPGRDG